MTYLHDVFAFCLLIMTFFHICILLWIQAITALAQYCIFFTENVLMLRILCIKLPRFVDNRLLNSGFYVDKLGRKYDVF